MSNEARSHSHRWLFEPDRLLVHEDGSTERVRGALIRQRLSADIKPGWRAAEWSDLDPRDPTTDAAFRWLHASKNEKPSIESLPVFRNGVPDPHPMTVEPTPPDEPDPSPEVPDIVIDDEPELTEDDNG